MCRLCNTSDVASGNRGKLPHHYKVAEDYIGEKLCEKAKLLLSKENCKGNDIDTYIINKLIKVYGGKSFGYSKVSGIRSDLFSDRIEKQKKRSNKYYNNYTSLRRIANNIREVHNKVTGSKAFNVRLSLNGERITKVFKTLSEATEYRNSFD